MVNEATPVLVVGGRTTGLTMACELTRHGVPVRIVDSSPGIEPHCRANLIHSRTLEVFQDLGIVNETLASGTKNRGINFYANGQHFLHVGYEGIDSPYPYSVALPQWRTEEILEGLLGRHGLTVERQTTLVAMTQHPEEIRATLRRSGGGDEIVETPWLIGCDGAHSTVRHLNHEAFPGEADPQQYVLADVKTDAPIAHDEAHGFLTDRGVLYFFLLSEGRHLVVADLPEHHDAATETPTLEEIQALVNIRGPAGVRVSDPRWLTYFRIHYRLTPHYRHGRTFLAGDAAHVHSLIGGQGMNTGIQDAYNLAWKLGLVARGCAPERLLDSYEAERRQVAEDVLESTRTMTETAEVFPHLPAADRKALLARMAAPAPEQLRSTRHGEGLDLDYRTSPICCGPAREDGEERFTAGPHAGAQAPDAVSLRLDDRTVTLFELLRGTRHTVLLFHGRTGPISDALDLAADIARLHPALLDVYVAAGPESGSCEPPSGVAIVHDPEHTLHRQYGVSTGCLYLIRPDGYVAYRSTPATMRGLQRYLDAVLHLNGSG